MDPSSIITQASPDEQRPLNTTAAPEKVEAAKREPTKKDRDSSRSRSRGLFCQLLCCFRPIAVQQQLTVQSAEENGVNRVEILQTEVYLLKTVEPRDAHKKCLVIDLDETLVHSSFQPVNNADFVIPVEIDNTIHQVYVLKRPHVDEFLQAVGQLFECVLFTASLGKYADPVTDLLDKWGVFRARLFREGCVFHRGNYVKDLSRLGRELKQVIILDNSPMSYVFHMKNAVPIRSWFDDPSDVELQKLIPFFKRLAEADDIYAFLNKELRVNGVDMTSQEMEGQSLAS